jgi:tetratricopeptide (TPR) repeat protein
MSDSGAAESESLFAKLVVEQGLARPDHVRECLDIIAKHVADHVTPPRLGELLVRKGWLSPQQLEATLRLPAKTAKDSPSTANAALPADVARAADVPGNRVGKFIRVHALGAGGMGEVWSGWDTELRRWVALKFLNSQSREELARFEREAQTAAKLSHPNIAAVYAVGEEGGRHYIALQLVRGRTLSVFPRDERRVLVEFLRQAALAVHYAHEEGIIHRDLKPQNLMVEGDPTRRADLAQFRVYVMDFGLAKEATTESSLSVSGTVLGTPSYMPPEQARGLVTQVDARSDVYSLGATLYEILTDQPPFKHQNVYEILKQVVEEEPKPPRKLNPKVDEDLETIVLRCLEKEPARRYPSARELAEDVGRYLKGEPILARPASVAYRVRKWVARRKALTAAMVAAVLAGVAAAGILTADAAGRAREAHELQGQSEAAFTARDWSRANELLGRYLALRPGDPAARERKSACERELDRLRREAESKVTAMEASALCQKALATVKEGKTLWRVRTAKPEQWEKLFMEAEGYARQALAKDSTSAGNHYTLGEILEARGRWLDAVAAYDRALAIDPGYAEAWQRRGICYLELFSEALMDAQWRSRRPEQVFAILLAPGPRAVEYRKNSIESLKRYSELRKDASESLEYRYAQIAVAIVQGKFVEADKASDALLAEVQTDERVWILKAASQIARLNFKGGAATLTKLIDDVAPALWRPYFFRGWIYLVTKDFDRAIADCTRAIELDPRQARTYAIRASAFNEKNDVAAAKKDYDHALEQAPDWGFILTARASARLRLGDDRGAVDDASRAMEIEPTDFSAPFVRSQAKWRLGDKPGALADAGRAIEVGPREPEGYLLRSRLRTETGDLAGAIEDATKMVELQPKDPAVLRSRGVLRWQAKDQAGALEDFSKAVELAPEDPLAYYSRGMHRLLAGDLKGAAEDAARGADLAPRDGRHRLLRGKVLIRQGDDRQALEELRKAVELSPALAREADPLIAQCRKKLGN